MDDTNLRDRILKVLQAEIGAAIEGTSGATELVANLGIDGDEGPRIVAQVAAEFNVDLAGFDAAEYFHHELGWGPLEVWGLIKAILLSRPVAKTIIPITVDDLVGVASCRSWCKYWSGKKTWGSVTETIKEGGQ